MLSPVWTPIGSMFSIEQMTTKLSATSRMTSSSYSFHPMTLSSIRISWTGREAQAALGQLAELFDVVGDAAADAAERERRPDDRREARVVFTSSIASLSERARPLFGTSTPISSIASRNSEPVFAHLDRVDLRADELHAVPRERAVLVQRDRQVQRRLAADGRQQRVGPLGRDDLLDDLGRQRLDVRAIGELGVRHDRRRVAVDEDHLEPFGLQRLARLRARVVELGRLADDDRTGADDEDALQICSYEA